jgi:hypothetical protein
MGEASTILSEIQSFEGQSEQLLDSNVDLIAEIVAAFDLYEVGLFQTHRKGTMRVFNPTIRKVKGGKSW